MGWTDIFVSSLSMLLFCKSSSQNYHNFWGATLIKKKIKFSSYIRKFRRDRLQSRIWQTASSYIVKNLRISSYVRKPFHIYDFATDPIWISLYMWKIFLSFYQFRIRRIRTPHPPTQWRAAYEVMLNNAHKKKNAKKSPLWIWKEKLLLISPYTLPSWSVYTNYKSLFYVFWLNLPNILFLQLRSAILTCKKYLQLSSCAPLGKEPFCWLCRFTGQYCFRSLLLGTNK